MRAVAASDHRSCKVKLIPWRACVGCPAFRPPAARHLRTTPASAPRSSPFLTPIFSTVPCLLGPQVLQFCVVAADLFDVAACAAMVGPAIADVHNGQPVAVNVCGHQGCRCSKGLAHRTEFGAQALLDNPDMASAEQPIDAGVRQFVESDRQQFEHGSTRGLRRRAGGDAVGDGQQHKLRIIRVLRHAMARLNDLRADRDCILLLWTVADFSAEG